jgi:hypothetical protein
VFPDQGLKQGLALVCLENGKKSTKTQSRKIRGERVSLLPFLRGRGHSPITTTLLPCTGAGWGWAVWTAHQINVTTEPSPPAEEFLVIFGVLHLMKNFITRREVEREMSG